MEVRQEGGPVHHGTDEAKDRAGPHEGDRASLTDTWGLSHVPDLAGQHAPIAFAPTTTQSWRSRS
ncbi:hypothetical protein BE61_26700 [Bradyrhizobium elkanii USDA 61]|nr:hypothetical protein BE61_26700 [Bradyrhizobium elkanii USDA 61]